MSGDDWLDLNAVAQWMGLGKTTVYRMIQRGELPVSGGRPNRVRRADLVEHLARCRLEAGALAAVNDYSPTRWRPGGPDVADAADFAAAVAEVLAGVGEGEVVSYRWVATEAGYPTRAKAVRDHLARNRSGLPWRRVTQADGCLSVPDAERQAGGAAGRGRGRHRSPGSPPSATSPLTLVSSGWSDWGPQARRQDGASVSLRRSSANDGDREPSARACARHPDDSRCRQDWRCDPESAGTGQRSPAETAGAIWALVLTVPQADPPPGRSR